MSTAGQGIDCWVDCRSQPRLGRLQDPARRMGRLGGLVITADEETQRTMGEAGRRGQDRTGRDRR